MNFQLCLVLLVVLLVSVLAAQSTSTATPKASTLEENLRDYSSVEAQPIVKIAKGLGDHGYNSLRVSVITDAADSRRDQDSGPPFTYDAPFAWKWTQYHLQSYLATGLDEGVQTLALGTNLGSINVSLPAQGAGVRGIVIGDPCYEPDFIGCIHFADNSTMKTRLPRLINAVAKSTDYRAIIGDNFYDQSGKFTGDFYRSLTPESQSKIEITALGNHDIWKMGFPQARQKQDSYANGYLQFYGQDTAAGRESTKEFMDLSVDPNKYDSEAPGQDELPATRLRPDSLPPASNFISYHVVGNTGFISYSGAHTWESYEGEFEKACGYFDSQTIAPKIIMLAGHWNEGHLGCQEGMDVPSVYEKISHFDGCDQGNLRYVAGHVHCNQVIGWAPEDTPCPADAGQPVGFMFGGTGVRGKQCNTFGFGYFSTTDDRELVVSFTLAGDRAEKNAPPDIFEEVMTCFETKGVENCLEHGEVWRDSSLK
eukprot:GSChrysophyteH1.ASY1.ANO1.3192.1 assembled CDS